MPTSFAPVGFSINSMPETQKAGDGVGNQGYTYTPNPSTSTIYGSVPNSGINQGGEVKNLPFAKNTTSMPNLSVLNPAFQQQLNFLSQAAPNYTSYFNQLSSQAFEDANRQAARLAASHGGAPTASTGNTGMNQAAFQGMLFDQLNKANVDRMWTTQDQWEQNKYNLGNSAYQNYFNALANRAYDTSEQGFNSGIYQGGNYKPFDPYANTSLRQGDQGSNSNSFSSPGGSAKPGGGSTPGGNSSPTANWWEQPGNSDEWNSKQAPYWTLDSYLDEIANRELQDTPMIRESDDWWAPENQGSPQGYATSPGGNTFWDNVTGMFYDSATGKPVANSFGGPIM